MQETGQHDCKNISIEKEENCKRDLDAVKNEQKENVVVLIVYQKSRNIKEEERNETTWLWPKTCVF